MTKEVEALFRREGVQGVSDGFQQVAPMSGSRLAQERFEF